MSSDNQNAKAITTTAVTTIFAKISLLKEGLLGVASIILHLATDTDLTKGARGGLGARNGAELLRVVGAL